MLIRKTAISLSFSQSIYLSSADDVDLSNFTTNIQSTNNNNNESVGGGSFSGARLLVSNPATAATTQQNA